MVISIKEMKKNLPKKNWIKEIIFRMREGEIWQHSTFVTYYVLLTAFPLLVGIINGLQAFGGTLNSLAWFVYSIVPGPLAEIIVQDMLQVFESSHVGIFIVATVSTVWTVSWIMASILMGLNKAYGVENRKNIVLLRILAFFMTLVFAAWIGAVVFFVHLFAAGSLIRWLVLIPLVFFSFCFIYYFVPNVIHQFRSVIPGALFSTLALFLGMTLYQLFLNQLPDDSTFFTLTGSLMVMLAILQKLSLAILAGGTINATVMQMQCGKVNPKGDSSKFIKLLKKTKMLDLIN